MSKDHVIPEAEISGQNSVNDKSLFSERLKG